MSKYNVRLQPLASPTTTYIESLARIPVAVVVYCWVGNTFHTTEYGGVPPAIFTTALPSSVS
jgi:hypothetical protein